MKKKIKSYIIVFLSLILAIFNATSNNMSVKAKEIANNEQTDLDTSRINRLNKNNDWLAVKKFWINLNHFNNDSNDSTPSIKRFEKLSANKDSVEQSLQDLVRLDLLSEKESSLILNVIYTRLSHLERMVGYVTCYKPSPAGFNILKTKNELENQYDILEKLYKENKITETAFNNAKIQIIKNISYLKKEALKEENEVITDSEAALLIYLNQ